MVVMATAIILNSFFIIMEYMDSVTISLEFFGDFVWKNPEPFKQAN